LHGHVVEHEDVENDVGVENDGRRNHRLSLGAVVSL
jgi:hypothetical protein